LRPAQGKDEPHPGTQRHPHEPSALLVLAFGVAALSCAAILIRAADAPALAIAAYRLLIAASLLVPVLVLSARSRAEVSALRRGEAARIVLAGVCLAVHFAAWVASLDRTSVASSVVIVTTSPLWVGLAAPLVLRERVPRALYLGIAIAFLGGATIAWGDLASGGTTASGDLLALVGAWAAAAYLVVGRAVRPRVNLLTYVTLVYGVAALCLVAAALGTGTPMSGYTPLTWTFLVLLAIVPQIVGHSSLNWALSRLSVTFVAGTVLGEAVGSTLLAWWLLGEAPPPITVVGGTLILTGLALAARAEDRPPRDVPVM
jgi:drug/metabolite transporter (DMT)-like permease